MYRQPDELRSRVSPLESFSCHSFHVDALLKADPRHYIIGAEARVAVEVNHVLAWVGHVGVSLVFLVPDLPRLECTNNKALVILIHNIND